QFDNDQLLCVLVAWWLSFATKVLRHKNSFNGKAKKILFSTAKVARGLRGDPLRCFPLIFRNWQNYFAFLSAPFLPPKALGEFAALPDPLFCARTVGRFDSSTMIRCFVSLWLGGYFLQ
ncbi:MAG TPA: hypothetical protein VKZ51_02090, partial [Cyclobacteriaceae bacterium]|nr:hypothetical protein [Cyclobacteriaceae bacterium]